MDILSNLDPVLKTFWFIAIPASLIFIIQTVMTFMGVDGHDGIEPDFNSNLDGIDDPFQLFSLRNLINFLLGFSWAGISFFETINNKILLIVISLAVGAIFIYVFFIIIKQLQKLQENNSFRISDAINKTAEVYLTIPERKTGKGKVIVSVKGAFHELEAMTENARIQTGAVVKISRVENNSILIVETI